MKIEKTSLEGCVLIHDTYFEDERGFFARSFCRNEFAKHGLNPELVQCNISFNKTAGTLRGMHYQAEPHHEDKLVRCTRGSILDVIIDLRHDSLTYCQWLAVELSAGNYKSLYIPAGFAHGYQTLEDDTELFYQMSEYFKPEVARGIRWNDPVFGIDWPEPVLVISEKDNNYPDYKL